MKLLKRVIIISFSISLIILSGCSKEKNHHDFSFKSMNERKTEQVTISYSFWGNKDRLDYTKETINQFMKENPDINVNLVYYDYPVYERKFKDSILNNEQSDLMQIAYEWIDIYSPKGENFYNLNELKDYIDLSNFDSKYLKYGKRSNKLNAIPVSLETYIPVYNTDIIEKFEVKIPNSLLELESLRLRLRPYKIYPFGMDKKDTVIWILAYYEQRFGFSTFDKSGKCIMEAIYLNEVLNTYNNLVIRKDLCPVEEYTDELFYNGFILGTMINTTEIDTFERQLDETNTILKIGNYHSIANAKHSGIFVKPSYMYAINKKTNHPTEAARLLEYLLNSESNILIQKTEKGIPCSSAAEEFLMERGLICSSEYLAQVTMEFYLDESNPTPSVVVDSIYIDRFINIINDFVNNKITVDEASRLIIALK